jgi:holin-like protein
VTASASRRPVVVTLAVVLVALSGLLNTVLGILILLSRYDVDTADVLPTSLVGIGIILFGLLTLAIASGIARGSRLSRLLLTVYLGIQFVLHAVTIVTSDAWDTSSTVQIVLQVALVVIVWAPPGSRYFRSRTPAADPYLP